MSHTGEGNRPMGPATSRSRPLAVGSPGTRPWRSRTVYCAGGVPGAGRPIRTAHMKTCR